MAYLRILKQDRRAYYYIVRSERRGDKMTTRVLEYLGRDPDPARLKAALKYWKVLPKGEGRRDRWKAKRRV